MSFEKFFNKFLFHFLCGIITVAIIVPIVQCSTKPSYIKTFDEGLNYERKRMAQYKNLPPTDFRSHLKEELDSIKIDEAGKIVGVMDFLYKLKYMNTFCKKNGYEMSSNYNNTYFKLFHVYETTADEKFNSLPKNYRDFYIDLKLTTQKQREESAVRFCLNNYETIRKELQNEISDLTIQDYCLLVDTEAEAFLGDFLDFLKMIVPNFLDN
jgi:hypothetical protein